MNCDFTTVGSLPLAMSPLVVDVDADADGGLAEAGTAVVTFVTRMNPFCIVSSEGPSPG